MHVYPISKLSYFILWASHLCLESSNEEDSAVGKKLAFRQNLYIVEAQMRLNAII